MKNKRNLMFPAQRRALPLPLTISLAATKPAAQNGKGDAIVKTKNTAWVVGALAATAFAVAPSASHAQSVTLTQDFTTSPASWTTVMQPGSQNNFGWSNTGFASGTAGEAGGTITRSASYSTYTTAVSNLNRASTLTMSGNMYFQNTDFDGGFYLGFFDSAAFSGTAAPDFVGFIVAEPSGAPSGSMRGIPRSIAGGNTTDGSVVGLTQLQQLTFNLTYTGSGDGSGTLTGTLGGTNIGTISTPAGSSTFNAFGLASGSTNNPDSNLNTNFYFDNVSYTSGLNLYWDNSGGAADSWGDASNWSTTVGGGSSPSAAAGAGDVARFSATPIVGTAQTVNLNANQSVLGLAVESAVTQGITFLGGGTNRTLSIGSSGVTNASNGSGSVAIGSGTAGQNVAVTLVGSQSWANNGSQNIVVPNTVSGSGSPTFTNSGTGTGGVRFTSIISNTVSKFVQDSATSPLSLRAAGSFAGGVEVKQGVLNFGNNSINLGTGTLTLGVNGGTGAVTAQVGDNDNISFGNAIVLTTGHTGPITIQLVEDDVGVSHSKTFTGGITGTNSFTIQNDGGNDNLNFNTGAINNTGSITHTGTATTGVTTINSVIGTNVTGLTQSGPARLVLAGTNTYTGNTTINAGTLALSSTGSIANSATIDVKSGATFDVSAVSGYTVGASQTLKGSGTVAGNTAISGTLAPGNSPGTLNVTGNLTFNAASIFEWELDATNGADPGVVANSGTYDRVIATGDLTGSGAVFEVVLGSNDFSDAFWDSNKTWTNIFTAGNSFDLASIFTSFSGAGVDSSGAVSGQGSFSLSGNTLSWNWAVIPELGNAAAGLLLAAGLLCRRRPAGLATTPPPRNDRDGSKPGLARDLDPDPRRC
jgi:autotransporter-associated beta strand protein